MQYLRKTLHVIVKAEDVQYMQELFTIAKDTEILTKYLGPNARVVMIFDGQRSKRGSGSDSIARVIRGCFDPVLVQAIDSCQWNTEIRVLTTPQDEDNERLAVMESVAWYKDAFGANVFDMSKKEKPKQLSARELEDLHAEHSVKTAGKQPGRYEGSPGVETFVVGQRKGSQSSGAKPKVADEDLEKFTKEELLELLRKTKITSHQGKI